AGLVGVLCGFGLAYLAERTDKSFRTADEVRRRLGLTVVGQIPLIPDGDTAAQGQPAGGGIDPMLCTYHRPQSPEAERYRAVRTAIYFSLRGKEHKVVQVTSPNMRDGKSTLAANLSVSIAQAGKQVVLIDTDFRRPRMHRIFKLAEGDGLAAVVGG